MYASAQTTESNGITPSNSPPAKEGWPEGTGWLLLAGSAPRTRKGNPLPLRVLPLGRGRVIDSTSAADHLPLCPPQGTWQEVSSKEKATPVSAQTTDSNGTPPPTPILPRRGGPKGRGGCFLPGQRLGHGKPPPFGVGMPAEVRSIRMNHKKTRPKMDGLKLISAKNLAASDLELLHQFVQLHRQGRQVLGAVLDLAGRVADLSRLLVDAGNVAADVGDHA